MSAFLGRIVRWARQILFDNSNVIITQDAENVQEALEALDGYLHDIESAKGADVEKYIDLDIGGGIRNALVKLGHLDNVPAVEFVNKASGIGRVRYNVSVPSDWVDGTNIIVKIFWSPVDAGLGNVKWRIGYKLLTSGIETIDVSMTTISSSQSAPGVLNKLVDTGNSFVIPYNQVSTGDTLVLNVERSSSEDTFNSTARMHLVRLIYTGRGVEN